MSTLCCTSPASGTMPVVRPEAPSDSTACVPLYMSGALSLSNLIRVVFSRFVSGFSGALASSSSGWMRSSL